MGAGRPVGDRIAVAPRVGIGRGVRVHIDGDGRLDLAEGVELERTHIAIGPSVRSGRYAMISYRVRRAR